MAHNNITTTGCTATTSGRALSLADTLPILIRTYVVLGGSECKPPGPTFFSCILVRDGARAEQLPEPQHLVVRAWVPYGVGPTAQPRSMR